MRKLTWACVGALALNVAHASMDRMWQGISDPARMSSSFERTMSSLPLSGKGADQERYWSSDYWARNKGGINYRWNAANPSGFNTKSPTKEQAMAMSESELRALAPSEKWDLLNGRYTYPLKKSVASYSSPSRPSWEGICDGWAGSALNHDEPTPKSLANPDGIMVPFGSSDIKGLLAWYYAKLWAGGYAMMGRRCNGGLNIGTDRCVHDMNAGAFHLVLANRLGREGLPFIADIDKGSQVWNHIAWDFSSTVVNSNLSPRSTSASGTVKVMRVRSVVKYIWLLTKNSWEPVLGTSKQQTRTRTYEYYLDLNSQGRVIGGDWISSQRPDFLWLERRANFSASWSRMAELLNDNFVSDDVAESEIHPEIDAEVSGEEIH